MYFNNLNECEMKFYLNECINCNECSITNKIRYNEEQIRKKDKLLSFLFEIGDEKAINDELKDIYSLMHINNTLYDELDKIRTKKKELNQKKGII